MEQHIEEMTNHLIDLQVESGNTTKRWVALGDGSYTGAITDPNAPDAGTINWHILADDENYTVRESGKAVLGAGYEFLYMDSRALDGIRIQIASAPGDTEVDVPYVIRVDPKFLKQVYSNVPLGAQAHNSASQPAIGSISTLKLSAGTEELSIVALGTYRYPKAVTLETTTFDGGQASPLLLSDVVASLGADEHQIALVCLDTASNALVYLATTADTSSSGSVPYHDDFDDADLALFNLRDNPTYDPLGIVYLYDGQSGTFEPDDFLPIEVRTAFPPPKAFLSLKDNWDAVTDPATTDDEDNGYSKFSRWINNSTPEEFVCLDASSGAAVWQSTTSGGGGGGSTGIGDYILIRDEKAQNTAGGTFNNGAWQTRDLNTEVVDTGNNASVSSNQITLDAGTYRVRIKVPAYRVDRHQARLQNITDSATTLIGTSEFVGKTASAAENQTSSEIIGRFTIASSKTFEVQHRCETSNASTGFGIASNWTTEVYTVVELIKE